MDTPNDAMDLVELLMIEHGIFSLTTSFREFRQRAYLKSKDTLRH